MDYLLRALPFLSLAVALGASCTTRVVRSDDDDDDSSSQSNTATTGVGGGGVGGASTGVSTNVGGGGPTDGTVLTDLGTQSAGNTPATFSFEIPDNAQSFSLTVTSATPNTGAILLELTAPDGTLLYRLNNNGSTSGPFEPSFSGLTGVPYAFLYPNSTNLPEVIPGTYDASFLAIDGNFNVVTSVLTGVLLTKRAPAPPTAGAFGIDIWVTESSTGLNASNAPNEPIIQEAIAAMQSIYANAGVQVDVAWRDVVGAPNLAVVDNGAELFDLFNRPDAERNGRLAVYLVDEIDLTQQGAILGIAAGVPGAPFFPGAPHASVLVSLQTVGFGGGTQLGETMAHEMGHYIGLNHTTERDASDHDPIPDTPECFETQQGTAFPELCTNADAFNFMFWTNFQSPQSQSDISPGQSFVVRHNPAIPTTP
ncbi:MAG: hypothetical protein AAF928_18115 [Myxococcota bacterium]